MASLFKKGLSENLLVKDLIENPARKHEVVIKRRNGLHKPLQKRLEWKGTEDVG